ncbi:AAA family ATPase [Candidatus Micrarchaeota archaeon]|nr:AAA family ATPase [Candidatus Micrarchaeota archaeon]
MRIGITGTPCTGKTTLAKALAKKLRAKCVSASDVVMRKKAIEKIEGSGEIVADLRKLKKELEKIIEKSKKVVVEGHLICEFSLPLDVLVILRANPLVLERRMRARRYAQDKIDENLLAEIIDYCLINSEQNYAGRLKAKKTAILQVDASGGGAAKVSSQLVARFSPFPPKRGGSKGKAGGALKNIVPPKEKGIDWSRMLLEGQFSRLARSK